MAEVFLKHNAFLGKTKCEIDGKDVVLEKCWVNNEERSCFQDWVYIFFEELHKKKNHDDYKVKFLGLPVDCPDLEKSKEIFLSKNSEINVSLKFQECKSYEKRVENLKVLFNKMQKESPYDELKTEGLKKNFYRALGRDEDIGVVATMSSGKSTLINSLLGRDLLPAKNEATTAIVAKIIDNDNQKDFTVTAYTNDNEVLVENIPADLEIIEKLNSDSNISIIEITGDIPYIYEKGLRLVLNDTPGPNNSSTKEHEQHTFDLLNADYKPMILYVFNATQLQTNDDNTLLNAVKEKINSPNFQSKDRFIFVLNKVDALDIQKGETVEKAMGNLRDYLEKHNIQYPQIYPVSAYLSKVVRMYKNGIELSEDEEDFLESKVKRVLKDERRQLCYFADLSNEGKKVLNEKIKLAKDKDDKYELLDLYSGVPAVEIAINEYIEKYAMVLKIKKAVESFGNTVTRLEVKGNSVKKIASKNKSIEEVIEKLDVIEKVLNNGKKGQAFRDKIDGLTVSSEIDKKIDEIKKELFSSLTMTARGEVEVGKGIELISDLERKIEKLSPKICADVDKLLKDSIKGMSIKIVDEYKLYVSDLVNVENFDNSNINMESFIITDIDGESLIYSYAETKNVKIGTRKIKNENKKWYKPWTWGESKYYTKDIYADREFVDFSEVYEKFLHGVISNMEKDMIKIKDQAELETSRFKSFFNAQLDELDKRIEKEILYQKKLFSNKEDLNRHIEEENKRLEWIEYFNKELYKVLEI